MKPLLVFLHIFMAQATPKLSMMKTNHGSTYGPRNHSNEDKIHGGSFVRDIRKFPWMVSIMIDKKHLCGGGLLTLNYVITACHCVADLPADEEDGMAKPSRHVKLTAYKFVAGTARISTFFENTVQVNRAKSIHFHPKCQHRRSLIYDSGLVKMRRPFHETPYVRPPKIFSWEKNNFERKFSEMFSNEKKVPKCVVSGWGDPRRGNYQENKATTLLKMLQMYVMTEKNCQDIWRSYYPYEYENFNFSDHGQICVASENLDESDCAGDSGSPLVCDGYLIATVSYGADECAMGAPSVYQTISEVLDWFGKNFKGEIDVHYVLNPTHRKKVRTINPPEPVSSKSYHPIAHNEISVHTVSLIMLTTRTEFR